MYQQEAKKNMKELDMNKACGPDKVSNWVLKECHQQLSDKTHKLITTSLKEETVPKDQKKTNGKSTYHSKITGRS